MFLLGLHGALAAPKGDKITSLPGLGEPSTPHYSGYLDVESGQGKIHLHYWLTTSQSATPDTDPVVLVGLKHTPMLSKFDLVQPEARVATAC